MKKSNDTRKGAKMKVKVNNGSGIIGIKRK